MIATWVRGLVQTKEERRPLFERLMSDTQRQAYSMALRLTGDATEAEDLLQETYLRAFRFFHRYDESLPFTSWLFRIMTNLHIDSSRRRARIKTVSIDQVGPDGNQTWDIADETAMVEREVVETALDAPIELGLKALNPEFRTAVLLADVEGLSYEEIAQVMETSVGTVRSRIHRGRRQLRSYLETSKEAGRC